MSFDAFCDHLAALLSKAPPRPLRLDGDPRHAAVLGIFRAAPRSSRDTLPGEPEMLFIRRAEVEGDPWSGHVAFPGGRMDPGDDGPIGAALRELSEELSLDLAVSGRILGALPQQLTVPALARRMVVHPFVAALHTVPSLIPNHEVAHVLWVPWRHLLDGVGRDTMSWHWKGQDLELPCRRLQGEVLWGMTLRMVEDLVRIWRPMR